MAGRFWNFLAKADEVHRLAWRFPALTYPLRFVSSTADRLIELALGQRHPNNKAVAAFNAARATRSVQLAAPSGSADVLFFTVRGWYAHVGTESVIAKGLAAYGVSSAFYLCGGRLSQCDFKPGSDPYVTKPLCRRCTGLGERITEAAGFETFSLASVSERGALDRAQALVGSLTRLELLGFRYKDVPIGDVVIPSVLHSLLRSSIGEDEVSVRVLRGFVASAIVTADACEQLLRRHRPKVVVMCNGLFFSEAIMLVLAQRAGSRVVTYERGVRPNTTIWAVDRPVVPFDLDNLWNQVRDLPLSNAQDDELQKMLQERRAGVVGAQDIWPVMSEAQVHGQGGSTTVLFTNVTWDTAVFKAAAAFEDMGSWIRETVEVYRSLPSHRLVIRIHPAEVRLGLNASREPVREMLLADRKPLPANVQVVGPHDSTSSYDLIDKADRVLVFASTIGVEAAASGKAVIVAGNAHYRGRGFTDDPVNIRDYQEMLRKVKSESGDAHDRREIARRYAYTFFFRFHVDFPWLDDTRRTSRSIQLAGVETSTSMLRLCELIMGRGLMPVSNPTSNPTSPREELR